MSITVWVLVVLVYSGHFINPAVPTLEFDSRDKCINAAREFDKASSPRGKGTFEGYCVKIEK